MANINVSVSLSVDSGFYVSAVTPNTSTSSRTTVQQGDTVTITFGLKLNTSSNVVVSGFTSGIFTDASGFTLTTQGQSVVKTVKTDATLTDDDILFDPVDTNFTNRFWYFTVESNEDTTPDAFNLGNNVTGASTSQYYYSNVIDVTGIDTPTDIFRTGTGSFKINNGSWQTTSSTVSNGDFVQCRILSSANFNTGVSMTLDIGGVTDSWTVTTGVDPGSGEIIDFPVVSGTLTHGAIRDFFNSDDNLRSCLKGGSFVPDITENSGVPSSGTLTIRDFLGSATSFYVDTHPSTKGGGGDTTSGPVEVTLTWYIGTDWQLGYGDGMNSKAEFKYDVNILQDDTGSGVSISTGGSNYAVYDSLNNYIELTATGDNYSEQFAHGNITFYARHKDDNSKIITASAAFNFIFFGP